MITLLLTQIVLGALFILLPLLALIDLLKSHFSGNDKLIWVIVVIFVPFIGAVLYFFIGRKQKVLKG